LSTFGHIDAKSYINRVHLGNSFQVLFMNALLLALHNKYVTVLFKSFCCWLCCSICIVASFQNTEKVFNKNFVGSCLFVNKKGDYPFACLKSNITNRYFIMPNAAPGTNCIRDNRLDTNNVSFHSFAMIYILL